MKKNMGSTDRVIRLVLAGLIVILYFINVISGTLAIVLLIIGAILLLTSFIGFCPLYAPFKFSTRSKKVAAH